MITSGYLCEGPGTPDLDALEIVELPVLVPRPIYLYLESKLPLISSHERPPYPPGPAVIGTGVGIIAIDIDTHKL